MNPVYPKYIYAADMGLWFKGNRETTFELVKYARVEEPEEDVPE